MPIIDMAADASAIFFSFLAFVNTTVDSMEGVSVAFACQTLCALLYNTLTILVPNSRFIEQSRFHICCFVGDCEDNNNIVHYTHNIYCFSV